MNSLHPDTGPLFDVIVAHLDIPLSYYEKARARHRSLGLWLQRDASKLAPFDPDIRPQGSFRYGTVNRPLRPKDAYDLDNVCVLKKLGKHSLTQHQLKELYGAEVQAYAAANNISAPVEEHHRCWRLEYADEVQFHLDTLPCVPEDQTTIGHLIAVGVAPELAQRAIAITDKRHPQYRVLTTQWFSSNPRGFAVWFESRAALGRTRSFLENAARAAVEDVPPYEWKTTLQRSIQILKRHRDVMFIDDCDLAPISMIITNLAARAYEGERELPEALWHIIEGMPRFVRSSRPFVPNPADPAEDYADKWNKDDRLRQNFWNWHAAVRADMQKLQSFLRGGSLRDDVRAMFAVDLTDEELRRLRPRGTDVVVPARPAPSLIIPSAARPWGHGH